jgi:P27 family predicted phage terminase small subunit
LTRLDGDLLAEYCETWARRQDALAQLGGEYVLHGDKGTYQNPLLHVANKALEQMLKMEVLLGLDKHSQDKFGVKGTAPKSGVKTRDRSQGPPPPMAKDA